MQKLYKCNLRSKFATSSRVNNYKGIGQEKNTKNKKSWYNCCERGKCYDG